jgi:inner membrane transporter RhtA
MISIQFGDSVAKTLFPVVGAGAMTGLRLAFASILLLVIWRPWRVRLTEKSYRTIALYGTSLGLMNLFFYLALERIPLGVAVALEFTGPLTVALFHSRRKLDFMWAFLALGGIALLMPFHLFATHLDSVGIFWALAAGLCWALYIIFGQTAGQSENLGAVTSIGMFFAALIVLPFSIYLTNVSQLSLNILPLALTVAVLSSALPYSLEMIALKKIPTKTFGILMSLEPAMAALMGYLNLKENLSAIQLLAIVCIILASAGGALTAQTKEQTHEI